MTETITLYTRPGCGLCDEMRDELIHRGYRVREVDVDTDPALVARYGWEIPVALRADGSFLASALLRLPDPEDAGA